MAKEEIHATALAYGEAWQRRNYMALTEFLPHQWSDLLGNRLVRDVREAYAMFELTAFDVCQLDYTAPAVCELHAEVQVNGTSEAVVLRWIREDDSGGPVPNTLPGHWRLFMWRPDTFVSVASS
jgi:hypothetical protein